MALTLAPRTAEFNHLVAVHNSTHSSSRVARNQVRGQQTRQPGLLRRSRLHRAPKEGVNPLV